MERKFQGPSLQISEEGMLLGIWGYVVQISRALNKLQTPTKFVG